MRPLEYPLLADENIHPEVIRALIADGKTVTSVFELGLSGKGDSEILENAYRQGYCVLTHDCDFGTMAVRSGEPFIGIIYLRPGHNSSAFVIETLRGIDALASDIDTPCNRNPNPNTPLETPTCQQIRDSRLFYCFIN